MSVLGRLLRLTKAELEAVLGRSMGRDDPVEKSHFGTAGASSPGDHSARGASNEDPVLARYYANLELPYGADLETVHGAWRKLTRKYHPDLHSQDEDKRQVATELVKGLNEAYEGLRVALERSS